MATSDSRFKGFRFHSYAKPPPLPPKDSVYLDRNNPSISSIDIPPSSPNSLPPDRPPTRKDKALAFLKFPKRSPRSPSGSGSGEGSIIIIGNDDLENPPPPEPDSQISTPWNFQHNIHVDEGYIGLPPSWSTSLASAGFTPEEIANIQARRAAGSLAPDLRYLYTERPTSPQVAGFQSAPSTEGPVLSNPTSRSASLPLTESARPPAPKLAASSSITRRPPPTGKIPTIPTEEHLQNGHKANQPSTSTTQSSDYHKGNQILSSSHSSQPAAFSGASNSNHYPITTTSNPSSHSGHSATDEGGQTSFARAPQPPSTTANAPSELGPARKSEGGESEDMPRTNDRVVAPKSIWGTKRNVITGKLSNPSLSSLVSSAKTPSSSSALPLYLQQQISHSTSSSSSFVAAASSSLSSLKVAAASTSLSIAAAVRNTKGVIRRGLGPSKDNDDSDNVENPEDEEFTSDSLDIDGTSGADDDAPAGPDGKKAVWQLYTRPKASTDASSGSLDVNQQQPTNIINITGKSHQSHLPFSRSQGSLRSLTEQTPVIRKANSPVSLNTYGSISQPSLNSVSATASGSGTVFGRDVRFIKEHQNSESISSLGSIPESEGSARLPDAAASQKPSVAPHLTLLHQNKKSLDLSSWSEALLSDISKSAELDLSFAFREGAKETVVRKGKNKDIQDRADVTADEIGVKETEKEKGPESPLTTAKPFRYPTPTNNQDASATIAGASRRQQHLTPTKPRYPVPARPIPPIIPNNDASSSTSIPPIEKPPSYTTGRSRSNSRSKPSSPTRLTAPPPPPPIGPAAYPHYHHGYGQSPKPPPAVPLPPPPPSASNVPITTTIAASATLGRRGIPPPPTSAAPFPTASVFSPPPSALKSPMSGTSLDSAQLWSEIETMMNPEVMQGMGLTGAAVEMGAGGVLLGLPPDSVKGSVKTGGGPVRGQTQTQGLRFPATGLKLDAGTSRTGITITTASDSLGSSADPSATLIDSLSPILPFSAEEERALRASEGIWGTKVHRQGGEKKDLEEGKGEGHSEYADVRDLEEKGAGSDRDDYIDQEEPIVHISKVHGSTDRLLIPGNHVNQRDQANRDSSRSSSSTLTAEAVDAATTTIVRKVSIARRAGAVVLKGGANGDPTLLAPVPASSSKNGIRSRNSSFPTSVLTEYKYPPSPLSSNFGNSSEGSPSSLSISPSSPSQDNYPTPVTDSASLASPLNYYLDGTQTPSPSPGRMTFGPLPPAAATKLQHSRTRAQNEGANNYGYNYSPDDEEEDSVPFAYPDEATVEVVHANMAAAPTTVPAPRPTIVINDDLLSTAMPATTTAGISTAPLSPYQQYRGWLSDVVAPLEEFIDETVDPRNHYLNLKEIAEGDSGSVFSACLNPLTASKLQLPPAIKAKDAEEMLQHPEQVKLVAIKSVAIVPSGSPKLVDLQRELTLMKGLPGHENVLGMDSVYVDLVEDSLWVRMELMERSLADMVGLVGDGLMLQDRMLARFASDVLCALEYLQKYSIAHRDVRSDNLLLNKHGFLKLADFSNAVQVTKNSPMCTDIVGVIFWQAPEVRKPPYNALKVDVWSLGATVWEMAQTEPPFSDTQQFGDRWPPLRQPKLYSPAFHDFLRKCSDPPSSRPNPSDLLKHPFIHNACGRPVIVHLLSQCMAIEQLLQETTQ